MRKTNAELERTLLSLGCAVRSNQKLSLLDSDPEKQVLKSLRYYWSDNAAFFLIYTSLINNIYTYIHVDRLIKVTKDSSITDDELCLLIAICDNISQKDHRFLAVRKKLYKPNLKMESPPKAEQAKYLIKDYGKEESLVSFGASVRKFAFEKASKLNSLPEILKINKWIKFRALFGANVRSDAAYVIFNSKTQPTKSEVARLTKATKQAVGKYYNDLSLLQAWGSGVL